jgi:hypothetical protein
MAKARHKAGGCTNGRFKKKKMGKGWSTHRKVRGRPLPVVRAPVDAGGGTPGGTSGGGTGGGASQ